jgi:hypothetical protein
LPRDFSSSGKFGSKKFPCFYPWLIWLFLPKFTREKNPKSLEKGRGGGGILNVFFFKTYSKFRKNDFSSFGYFDRGLDKKNTAVFICSIFFVVSGGGDAIGIETASFF